MPRLTKGESLWLSKRTGLWTIVTIVIFVVACVIPESWVTYVLGIAGFITLLISLAHALVCIADIAMKGRGLRGQVGLKYALILALIVTTLLFVSPVLASEADQPNEIETLLEVQKGLGLVAVIFIAMAIIQTIRGREKISLYVPIIATLALIGVGICQLLIERAM